MPERLVAIHFPEQKNQNPKTSNPWYWWIDQVHPSYFSFLFKAWVRMEAFTIVKILKIDPRQPIPTPLVGFPNIETAIANWNPDTFGRFDEREEKFWDLITGQGGVPKSKPKFNVVKGQLQTRPGDQTNINAVVKNAIFRFRDNFDALANGYNKLAAGVGANGFHYPGQSSKFNIPLPDGPPTTVGRFNQQLSSFVKGPPYLQSAAYIGPISATAFFNINTFTTQAQAFTISVGQLDPAKWNMAVFPPVKASNAFGGRSSLKSKDYSGYGPSPFPLHGLEIT